MLFLVAGLGKIGSYAATAGYMTAVGLPSALLPAVIATEVLGAIAIVAGWQTRITAFLLAGFTLLSALIFHNDFGDQVQSRDVLEERVDRGRVPAARGERGRAVQRGRPSEMSVPSRRGAFLRPGAACVQ